MTRKSDIPTCPDVAIRRRILDSDLESAENDSLLPGYQLGFHYFDDDQKKACFRLLAVVGEQHLFFGRRTELLDNVNQSRALGAIEHVKCEIAKVTRMFTDTLDAVRAGSLAPDVASIRTGGVFRVRLRIFAMGLAIESSRVSFSRTDTRRVFAHNVRLSEADSVLASAARRSPELFPVQLIDHWKSNAVDRYRPLLVKHWFAQPRFLARMRKLATSPATCSVS